MLLFLYTTKSKTLTTYDMPQKRWNLSITFNSNQKVTAVIYFFLYPFVCQLLGAFVTYTLSTKNAPITQMHYIYENKCKRKMLHIQSTQRQQFRATTQCL